jgi:membrane protease YdiL (CAAX protease family)
MFAEFNTPPNAPSVEAPSPRLWLVRDMLYGIALLFGSLAIVGFGLFLADSDAAGEVSDVGIGVATLVSEALFGLAVVCLAYRRGLSAADLGFVAPRSWGPALLAWFGTYAILTVYQVALQVLEAIGVDSSSFEAANSLPVDARQSVLVFLLFAAGIVIVAPLAEELFFRALLFRGMSGYWRLGTSIFVSGLAFGLFHVNLGVVIPFTAIGALFAWANHRTGSIWTSISAHAGINTVSFALSLAAGT